MGVGSFTVSHYSKMAPAENMNVMYKFFVG